jgi:predicted trehalose synthase
MREAIFDLLEERPGAVIATSTDRCHTLHAATIEELRHEARDLLMRTHGDAHVSFRVRIRRPHG